jgi:RNA polymerase sigma-70 factor (ECF subfamily)
MPFKPEGASAVTEEAQPVLLDYLTKRYASLKDRLTRVLGNADLAGDALHDTWLRLQTRDVKQETVQSPGSYLVRMAVNIAIDVHRKQSRTVSSDEVDALLDEIADPAPGPLQEVEGRAELRALANILQRLPTRRRHVVVLVHWEGLTQKETAKRLKVSLRTVESDLKRAHEYLHAYLAARNANRRF